MRRLVLAFTLIVLISVAGGLAVLFVMRDHLLLREARLQAEKLHPLHVEIGTLHTSLAGAVAIELGDLEARNDSGLTLKVKQARVESPLSLFGLYRAWRAKEELPLTLTVDTPRLALPAPPPKSPAVKGAAPAWPASLPLPGGSPVPVHLTLAVKGGEASGAVSARELTARGDFRLRDTGMEAALSATASVGAGEAFLPVAADLKLAATREALKLQSLAIKAAGLEAAASGELALRPVKGAFRASLDAPDLARVALRPEDRAALGLTAQPAGSVSLKMEGVADEAGRVSADGFLRLASLSLPLRAPEKTAFAALAAGSHVDGVVLVRAEVPFRLTLASPSGVPSVAVDKASAGFDFTQAALVSAGRIEKPRGIPLRGELTLSSGDGGVEIPALGLTFHTLTLTGSAALPAPLGSRADSAFRLNVSSLAGFPALLPQLRDSGQPALSEARGSIAAEGRVRLDLSAPGKSLVDLRTLSVKDLRLPLAYRGEAAAASGVITGSANGGGRYDAGDVNVTRTSGSFDLTQLDLSIPGKLAKKKGRKLLVAFDAQGTPARLNVKKASLSADGLTASLSGTAAFDARRNATLNLQVTTHAELAPLREYLPKLPAKISGGALDAVAKIGGTWLPAGGIEKSPLALTGKFQGKLGSVMMEEAPPRPPAEKAPEPAPLLPPWPLARNASLTFRLDVAEFHRGALSASGVSATGSLSHGNYDANVTVARAFGGKVSLSHVTGSLASPKLGARGAAVVDGLDLSQAAAFVDPSYGKIVKGSLKASATFALPDAFGEHLLEETNASGDAQVHNGYLSTASFDGLVNEKLKGLPGVGDKAKVSTGGLAAEIRTRYSVAKGAARLTDFVAETPHHDEMRLAGTLNLAFDADLAGTAHLANAPVAGSIREANSDPQGRLVVPVRFHGNLKNPGVEIAAGTVEAMLKNTAAHEGERLKNQALDAAKKKAQQGLQDAAGGLLDGLLKK